MKKYQCTSFTMRKATCRPVTLNNQPLPQSDHAKYLGMYLDRKLTWEKHILTKRTQLDLKLRKLYWIIGRQSKLSLENKLLLYKTILKPVWTYGIQLWGSAANSNRARLSNRQTHPRRVFCASARDEPGIATPL